MKENIKCLLCERQAQIVETNYPGYQYPDTFSIYDCPHCNTQFSFPRIDASGIYDFIYKNSDKVPGYDRYHRYYNQIKNVANPLKYLANSEEAYWAVYEALKAAKKQKSTTKILEVGCGMGYLTYALNNAGYNATGLDISHESIKSATEYFGKHYICSDVFNYADKHKNEYDYIILTQVIEHVEKPVELLAALVTMIKNDTGKIIVTTENKSLFPKTAVWQTDYPPVHAWWFSEQSMMFISNQLKTNITFIDFSKYRAFTRVRNITQVPYNKHTIGKNGEILLPIINNNILVRLIKKIPFARWLFGKRDVMGIILTK